MSEQQGVFHSERPWLNPAAAACQDVAQHCLKVGDLVLRDGIRQNPTDELGARIIQGTLVSKAATEAEELVRVALCGEKRRQQWVVCFHTRHGSQFF